MVGMIDLKNNHYYILLDFLKIYMADVVVLVVALVDAVVLAVYSDYYLRFGLIAISLLSLLM